MCRPESENDIFLYGVFDGHEGGKLSNFAAQRFPAEILLGQLSKNKLEDDDEILNVLHQVSVQWNSNKYEIEKHRDAGFFQLAEAC